MFEMELILFLILLGIIICAFLGSQFAAHKRKNKVLWSILCAIFPPIIIFLIAINSKKLERHEIIQCPVCRGFIKRDATSCKICGRSLREYPVNIASTYESEKPFTI